MLLSRDRDSKALLATVVLPEPGLPNTINNDELFMGCKASIVLIWCDKLKIVPQIMKIRIMNDDDDDDDDIINGDDDDRKKISISFYTDE